MSRLPFQRSDPRNFRPPFDPLSLTGVVGWWRADQGIAIATGVSQWDDISGNGNHLTQAVGASQPTFEPVGVNGQPYLDFDGADDSMQAAFTLVQPETIFIVFANLTYVVNQDVTDGVTAVVTMALEQSSTGLALMRIRAGALPAGVASSGAGLVQVGIATFNGAASSLGFNGAAPTVVNAGAGNGDGLRLGGRQDDSNFADVDIYEVLLTNVHNSDIEKARFAAYAMQRYAI